MRKTFPHVLQIELKKTIRRNISLLVRFCEIPLNFANVSYSYDFIAFSNGDARFAELWNCKFILDCVIHMHSILDILDI